MAWKEVTVKKGNKTFNAFMRRDDLELPNKIGKPETVNVDGKTLKVKDFWVDERDDIITIKLAMASTTKEKSDDKPTKGRD